MIFHTIFLAYSSTDFYWQPPKKTIAPIFWLCYKKRMLSECKLLELPQIHDPRGNLTFVEGNRHIPFDIKRVYYLYDVPGGASRAAHGHQKLEQLMIAMSGSFDVTLDDGEQKQRIHLNRSYYGLYIPSMMWRDLDNFSSNAVCMVLASDIYDESDYYRDYGAFLAAVRKTA